MTNYDVAAFAAAQREASRRNEAVNQCRECGAFRTDGLAPTVHRSFCARWVRPWGDDKLERSRRRKGR